PSGRPPEPLSWCARSLALSVSPARTAALKAGAPALPARLGELSHLPPLLGDLDAPLWPRRPQLARRAQRRPLRARGRGRGMGPRARPSGYRRTWKIRGIGLAISISL